MRKRRRLVSAAFVIVMLVVLGGVVPARAQSSDVEKLLDLLVKKSVITAEEAASLREEVAQERVVQQAKAAEQQQAQALRPKEQNLTASRAIRVSGFAQTRFTSAAGTKNTLEIRRARLDLRGDLSDKFSYRVLADFVRSPVLLDAFVDYRPLSFERFRVGQFLVPFSQENLTPDRDSITVERSIAVNSLSPGRDTGNNGRDIGLMNEGNIVRGDGRPLFDYSVALFNGAGINTKDNNHRKDASVRLVAHLSRELFVAGDYYNGATGSAQVDKERSEFEFNFTRRSWTAQGEYIWGRDGDVHKRGSYTLVGYKFHPQWQGIFRYEDFDPNRHAANDETHSYVFGVTWFINDYVKWQVNYNAADEGFRPKLNNQFLTQFQFMF